VDYEAMKAGLGEAVPFVKTIGLEYVDLGPGTATVRLPDRPEQANHVGSQHAGTLFTVAETASGGAFVSAFAERLGEVTPLAKSARISYEKIAKGPIDATATLADADGLLETLDEDGKVEFAIDVELKDADGNRIATATIDWHVRKNDA
jgi:acyl-coenzyme A thioesterase PaaI-like protein